MDLKNKVLRTNRTQGAHSYNAEMRRLLLILLNAEMQAVQEAGAPLQGVYLPYATKTARTATTKCDAYSLIALNAEIRAVQGVARTPPRAY